MPSSVDAPVEKRRAVRIFHTSDWHLGRQTADVDRTEDFRSFLTWLLGQISERRPDVLLIAGDIFDTTMPSSDAQRLYYDFLTKASQTALSARRGCAALRGFRFRNGPPPRMGERGAGSLRCRAPKAR